MRQLFRCEYCDKIDVEEEILKHETTCFYNRLLRSCMTCKNAEKKITKIVCKQGKEVPEGQQYTGCDMYVWDEIDHAHPNPATFSNLFGGIFG